MQIFRKGFCIILDFFIENNKSLSEKHKGDMFFYIAQHGLWAIDMTCVIVLLGSIIYFFSSQTFTTKFPREKVCISFAFDRMSFLITENKE